MCGTHIRARHVDRRPVLIVNKMPVERYHFHLRFTRAQNAINHINIYGYVAILHKYTIYVITSCGHLRAIAVTASLVKIWLKKTEIHYRDIHIYIYRAPRSKTKVCEIDWPALGTEL